MAYMRTAIAALTAARQEDPDWTLEELLDWINFQFRSAWIDFLIQNVEELPRLSREPHDFATPRNFLLEPKFGRGHKHWGVVYEFYNFKRDLKKLRRDC